MSSSSSESLTSSCLILAILGPFGWLGEEGTEVSKASDEGERGALAGSMMSLVGVAWKE